MRVRGDLRGFRSTYGVVVVRRKLVFFRFGGVGEKVVCIMFLFFVSWFRIY